MFIEIDADSKEVELPIWLMMGNEIQLVKVVV